jgi:hypothetical protein
MIKLPPWYLGNLLNKGNGLSSSKVSGNVSFFARGFESPGS